ncbi:hypothetical protein GCM10027290_38850 [Micromonospora sonneratiae]|uniref:Transcriptional regulator n=1 Tax=Micromonospora sonneratiae TaxID=1184706 RepID=A0ABW3YAL2_9ACTN
MPPLDPYPCTAAPTPLGPILAKLRLAHGWSQLQLAERLCEASGVPTISRHEVSRWERQQRIPGDFWLGWLATVLETPLDRLAAATEAVRTDGTRRSPRYRPEPDIRRARQALLTLAHAWVTDPAGALGRLEHLGQVGEHLGRFGPFGPPADDPGPPSPGASTADLADLRRLDDIVGGLDLIHHGRLQLARALSSLADSGRVTRRRVLPLVAEAAQLAGWLAADAGDTAAALTTYRTALIAAADAGDRALAAHILGSASHLLTATGDPDGALILARTGRLGSRQRASAGLRALLLHRAALAAAVGGRHRTARSALTAAQQAAERRNPGADPPWLYWLDDAELTAMTGRCLAALRRPMRAEPILAQARQRATSRRASALYGSWLARTYLQLGEVEQACEVADSALLDAVAAGSARAAVELAAVRRELAAHHDEPAVRRHAALVTAATPYLPTIACRS